MPEHDDTTSTGRRNYDVELAELKYAVTSQRAEIQELRADIKDLLEAWRSAKGLSSFVKWASGITIAIGILKAKSLGLWS